MVVLRLQKIGSIAVMLASVTAAQAASITLESVSSGVFQYQLTLAPGDDIFFDQNAQINLTGLSGVTATSALDIGFTSCGFTVTSVCFAEQFLSQEFFNSGASPTTTNLFTVTSTATSVGLANYTAAATTPFEGQVDGPVPGPSVPEPSTGLLTAAGLVGLGLSLRRILRFPSDAPPSVLTSRNPS